MKRLNAAPFLALAMALVSTTSGFAGMGTYGGGNTEKTAGTPTSNQINSPMGISNSIISGTVLAIDRTSNTLEVRDSAGMLRRIPLDNNTQVTRHGTLVQPSDISTGDAVVVRTNNSAM